MKIFNKLCYFYHKEIYIHNDQLYAQPYFAKPINEFSKYTKNLIMLTPVRNINANLASSLTPLSTNITSLPMPEHGNSFLGRFKKIKEYRKIIRNFLNKNDIDQILIECPSFYAIYIHSLFRKKSVFFFIGDQVKALLAAKNISPIKKFILYVYWYIDKLILSLKANREISFGGNYRGVLRGVFVNQYPLLNDKTMYIENTYHKNNVIFREKLTKIPKIIYVLTCQRLDNSTNISQFINLTKKLLNQNFNIKWNIIGSIADYSVNEVDTQKNNFQMHIEDNNLTENIKLLGNIEHGDKFNSIIDNSHIYIAPNKSTGGNIGRVGYEMMSRGLPIISCPLTERLFPKNQHDILITNNGYDLEYNQYFLKIFKDLELYNKISFNASMTAQNHSVENTVRRAIEHIYYSVR